MGRHERFIVRHEADTDLRVSSSFTVVPNVILRNPNMNSSQRLLYAILLSFDWEVNGSRKGYVHPSQEVLAEHMGLSDRQVRNILTELRDLGLLNIYLSDDGYNVYEFRKVTRQTIADIEKSQDHRKSISGTTGNQLPAPTGNQFPTNKTKEKKEEEKQTWRGADATTQEPSSRRSSGKTERPTPSPRPARGIPPHLQGSRAKDADDEVGVKKTRDGRLPERFEDYNTKHWVTFFRNKMNEVAEFLYVPSWIKDQGIIKRMMSDGVSPAEMADGIEWFANNYTRLGVKNPSVAALRGYWNAMSEKRRGGKPKREGKQDDGGMFTL